MNLRMAKLMLVALTLAGCAIARFDPAPLQTPDQLRHVQSDTRGGVSVSVAALSDSEAAAHFGIDLAAHGVQAVWISVRNPTANKLWFIRNLVDPDFYSADEAALLLGSKVSDDDHERLKQYLRDESIRALIQPRTITQGYLYLPRREGGRYLDVRLSGDAYDQATGTSSGQEVAHALVNLRFGFALPLADGHFDYEQLHPNEIYADKEVTNLDAPALRAALQNLPCCVTNASGTRNGDPLNIALVGSAMETLNALSKSGWSFTHRIDAHSIAREVGAAISDQSYPVAPVSTLYNFGRGHDLALQRARHSIARRNHLRLWLAPFRFEGKPVWVGQVSRDIGVKLTTHSPTFTTHVIDPEVDDTREYLLHSLLAAGMVDRFGFVSGSQRASPQNPARNLSEDPYFSDGMRLLVVLAKDPVPLHEVVNLRWGRSAAPVAEGQSGDSSRNVIPIAVGEQ